MRPTLVGAGGIVRVKPQLSTSPRKGRRLRVFGRTQAAEHQLEVLERQESRPTCRKFIGGASLLRDFWGGNIPVCKYQAKHRRRRQFHDGLDRSS